MPLYSCHFPINTKYSVLILYALGQGWADYGPRGHFVRLAGQPHKHR